ncbi:MAG: helix-turn-helix domain-containing protein [Gammaproteobacteria bacterium]|nr:helix-turn-helix domain-containing protein [Gammaproteobacteria bacterium]
MHNVILFPPIAANCSNCRWSGFCFAQNLDSVALAEFSRQVIHSGPIRRGNTLFRQGDKLKSLYVIRAGSVRTYLDSEDGCEQSVAFLYPGDLLGFDAVAENRHPTTAVALETTAYCAIPYDRVVALAGKFPGLWHGVIRTAAAQVTAGQNHVLLVGQKSAPARLAKFLLCLSEGFVTRGCSRTEFNLSMSRQEIANYLAVAVETISRLFSDLQRRGVIAVDRRFVQILSLPALQELACDSAQLRTRTA